MLERSPGGFVLFKGFVAEMQSILLRIINTPRLGQGLNIFGEDEMSTWNLSVAYAYCGQE